MSLAKEVAPLTHHLPVVFYCKSLGESEIGMIGIYKIENLVNGKVYVGQSKDIEKRWWTHKNELVKHKHANYRLQDEWDKYGEDNFEFYVIDECKEDELDEKEKYWISEYYSFDREFGYNIQLGGKDCAAIVRPLLQFDLYGNLLKEWNGAYNASEETGTNLSAIYATCKKKYYNANKFIWIWKEDYTDELLAEYVNEANRRIIQYDLYGNIVKIWNCETAVEKELGFSIADIVNKISNGKRLTRHGYIWKKESDEFEITEEFCKKARESQEFLKEKPVCKIDKYGNVIETYSGIRATKRGGYSTRLVRECINGTRKLHKGYAWVFEENLDSVTPDFLENVFKKDKALDVPILMCDMNDNVIKQYDHLHLVEIDGFIKSNVADCCKGRSRQYKGYIWKYKLDA